MTVIADTNVLIRAVVQDDAEQGRAASAVLLSADKVCIPSPCLCEFVWVLRRVYKIRPAGIERAIRTLLASDRVVADRSAIEDGLSMLASGGDFADGVIASEGRRMRGAVFVSFDKTAVSLLSSKGFAAMTPAL